MSCDYIIICELASRVCELQQQGPCPSYHSLCSLLPQQGTTGQTPCNETGLPHSSGGHKPDIGGARSPQNLLERTPPPRLFWHLPVILVFSDLRIPLSNPTASVITCRSPFVPGLHMVIFPLLIQSSRVQGHPTPGRPHLWLITPTMILFPKQVVFFFF